MIYYASQTIEHLTDEHSIPNCIVDFSKKLQYGNLFWAHPLVAVISLYCTVINEQTTALH